MPGMSVFDVKLGIDARHFWLTSGNKGCLVLCKVYKTTKTEHLLKEKCAMVFQQAQCIYPEEYFGAWGSLTGKYLFPRSTKISDGIELIHKTAAFAIKTQFGRESK